MFILFPELPRELRRAIWKLCLPRRVLELDSPRNDAVRPSCEHRHSSRLNTRYPIITRVCHESREVAFENGNMLGEYADLDQVGYFSASALSERWFCPATDIVHLHWDGHFDVMTPDNLNPIFFFLSIAAKSSSPASIVADLVGGGLLRNYSSDQDGPNFDPLEGASDYTVALEVINLHISFKQATSSGLFGRLGEERVQLIDADDLETIHKYYDLWISGPRRDRDPASFFELALSPEAFRQRLQIWHTAFRTKWLRHKWKGVRDESLLEAASSIWLRHDVNQIETPLEVWNGRTRFSDIQVLANEDHPWVKQMLSLLPKFSPVIMFRFCERECYLTITPTRSQSGD